MTDLDIDRVVDDAPPLCGPNCRNGEHHEPCPWCEWTEKKLAHNRERLAHNQDVSILGIRVTSQPRSILDNLGPASHSRCVLDCDALYQSMNLKRKRLGLSWRGVGRQLGISASTFSRLKAGHPPHADTLCSLIWWMDYGWIAYVKPNPRWSP
jgi:hypothetical protein